MPGHLVKTGAILEKEILDNCKLHHCVFSHCLQCSAACREDVCSVFYQTRPRVFGKR